MRRAIVIACLALATAAGAEDRKAAEALFRAGESAFRKQQYAIAATHFEAAYKAAPLAEIAFSAAQAYRRQWFIDRQPRPETAKRAIELYRIYLDVVKAEGRRGDASDGIAELQRELDKLAPSAVAAAPPPKPQTKVAVSVVVAGEETKRTLGDLSPLPSTESVKARATLDGKPVELLVPQDVTPGRHEAEVIADGYFPSKREKQIVDGDTDVIEVTLQPKPATLVVRSAGRVRVDGIDGTSTRELPAGKHVVAVLKNGHEPVLREVALARGESRTLDIALAPTEQRRRAKWVLVGSAGLGGLALISSTIAIYYDAKMSEIDDERTSKGISEARYDEYRRATDRRDTTRTLAIIVGGGALVGAGIALGMYVFDRPTTDGMRIVPEASPGGGALTVHGNF